MGAATTSDVLIVGGGLAGLTLALQLRARCPQLSIRILERRAEPAPPAAFKVGESFDTFERALAWLRVHQPALADRLDGRRDATRFNAGNGFAAVAGGHARLALFWDAA